MAAGAPPGTPRELGTSHPRRSRRRSAVSNTSGGNTRGGDEDDFGGGNNGDARSTSPRRSGHGHATRATTSIMRKPHTSNNNNNNNNVEKVTPAAGGGKWSSFRVRLVSGLCLMATFISAICSGHLHVWIMILAIQTIMVHELFTLAYQIRNEKRNLPWFRTQQWWFFLCAVFYVHGRFLIHGAHPSIMTKATGPTQSFVQWCLNHHTFVSYAMYIAGFVLFVVTLKKRFYLEQFVHFAWIHMTLLVVFAQSSFFVSNVFNGLIWFVLPSWLVIWNDVMAYLFGKAFGRTQLIKLSPKKTLEGFIGALFMTLLIAPVSADFLMKFRWMTCPAKSLSYFRDTSWLDCDNDETFLPMDVTLDMPPRWVLSTVPFPWVRDTLDKLGFDVSFTTSPLHLHSLVLALFAALIAPFGGFFASGLKRAFRIKDFGASIPGHGGLTDRFDCQVVMAMFTYIYYHSFVEADFALPAGPYDVSGVWEAVNTRFTNAERLALYDHLGTLLNKSVVV